jgi:hypothetical protein
MIRAAMIALGIAALAACGGRPTEADCSRMLDHFLEVEGTAATAGKFSDITPAMKDALAAQQRDFRSKRGADFVGRCRDQLAPAEVECAIAAPHQVGMDRCEGR